MQKRHISELWIRESSEIELRAALRLTGALAPSEPKWSEWATKAIYKELRRRQAAESPPEVVQALIFP